MSTAAARLLLALLLALGVAAPGRGAEDLPAWPHEQQAMLRNVEEELLRVQRKLFKARRQNDAAGLDTYGAEFRALQEQRRELIRLTRDQLPSQ